MRLLTTIFFLVCSLSAFNQDTIRFSFNPEGNWVTSAIINQIDTVQLMIHTASEGFTLVKPTVTRMKSLSFESADTVKSWGGEQEARRSEHNTIQLGRLKLSGSTIWENELSGPGTDGKLGLLLFDNKVIEINIENQRIIIWDELPELPFGYDAVTMKKYGPFFTLPITLKNQNQESQHYFMIHSGYTGTLLLDDDFSKDASVLQNLEIISQSNLKDAYGNILQTKKGRLASCKIGQLEIDGPEVAFFSGSISNQRYSVTGTGFLNQFNWFLDYKEGTAYMKQLKKED